jgi:beta-galactosidase
LIHFTTKGEGTFRAAANGDAANLDLFHLPQHHAFAGELTAIVEGNCTLTATAKGLKKAIITIQ